jgi:small subunit ribosomal protein S21
MDLGTSESEYVAQAAIVREAGGRVPFVTSLNLVAGDEGPASAFRSRYILFRPRLPPCSFEVDCRVSHSGQVVGVMSLAEIKLQEGESIENALRRFKRKVQTEDIIKEVKRHSYYLKPGEKMRLKQAMARKRARKKTRKEQD